MNILFLATLTGALLGWLMGFLSIFLILLILIQRGKGGGLTGALGGAGGQSAFGSKAGDTFTVITIVIASFWGFTCAFTMWLLGTHAPPAVAEQPAVYSGPEEEDETEGANEDLLLPSEEGGLRGPRDGETGEGEAAAETDDRLVPIDEPSSPAGGAGAEPDQR